MLSQKKQTYGAMPQHMAQCRRNAFTHGAMPQHMAQCHHTWRNATTFGAMPQHTAQCWIIGRNANSDFRNAIICGPMRGPGSKRLATS